MVSLITPVHLISILDPDLEPMTAVPSTRAVGSECQGQGLVGVDGVPQRERGRGRRGGAGGVVRDKGREGGRERDAYMHPHTCSQMGGRG